MPAAPNTAGSRSRAATTPARKLKPRPTSLIAERDARLRPNPSASAGLLMRIRRHRSRRQAEIGTEDRHDSGRGSAVAVDRVAGAPHRRTDVRVLQDFDRALADPVGGSSNDADGAGADALGPLGGLASDDHGHPE